MAALSLALLFDVDRSENGIRFRPVRRPRLEFKSPRSTKSRSFNL
jgi:hypothetical protein